MKRVKWNEFKKYSDDLGVPMIWSEGTVIGLHTYYLSITHKGLSWVCTLTDTAEDAERAEFEANYKGLIVELSTSKKVNSLIEDADSYIPPNGAKIIVISFHAEAPYNANAVCKLLWDFGGFGEQVIWSTQGSSELPFKPRIIDCDGIKKIAVSCDNGTLGSLLMSAYAKILVINNG